MCGEMDDIIRESVEAMAQIVLRITVRLLAAWQVAGARWERARSWKRLRHRRLQLATICRRLREAEKRWDGVGAPSRHMLNVDSLCRLRLSRVVSTRNRW